MIYILCRDSSAVVFDLNGDSVVDHVDAYMDLVSCCLSVIVDVLNGICKQVDDAPDYQLMVAVQQRHRCIVGKREDNASAAGIVRHAGIRLLNAVTYIKDSHPAGMRTLRKNKEVVDDILHSRGVILNALRPDKEAVPLGHLSFSACVDYREYGVVDRSKRCLELV